jgi:vitellogenic carboxypeptidase-like protein
MADGEGSELAGMIDVSGSRPGRTEGSALFYWFTPAQTTEAPEKQPLLIWLQGMLVCSNVRDMLMLRIFMCHSRVGGPGSSGSLGLFFEVGPYYLNERLEIEDRTVGQWNRDFNVVFLDQPIGTGYSYAGKDNAYATNEDEVAQDLHYFLQQWYNLYPQYADCPVFLTGESYAGHYIPAFAYKILEKNGQAAASGDRVVPLAGAAIGDGLTDPCAQVEAGPRAAYDFGLIDQKTFAKAKAAALKASAACAKGNFTAAHDYREEMEAIVAVASGINMYDVRTFEDYSDIKNRMNVYLNDPATKQRLHVPADKPFLTDSQVAERLYDDVMQSQLYTFPSLLKNMRVMLYQVS